MRKLIIGLLFVILAGCGQSGQAPTSTAPAASPSAVPPTPTAGEQPAPTSATGGEVHTYLTLEQSGGFAGLSSVMTIDTDGKVRLVEDARGGSGGPRELQLTPEQLSRLRDLVDSAEFQDLDAKYISETCADCFNYTISIERERGKGAQVIMTDDAGEKPEPLDQLLRLLHEIKYEQ